MARLLQLDVQQDGGELERIAFFTSKMEITIEFAIKDILTVPTCVRHLFAWTFSDKVTP